MNSRKNVLWKKLASMLLALALLVSSFAGLAADSAKPSAQDDFYDFANYDWAQTAEIPSDEVATGGFYSLETDTSEMMRTELEEMAAKSNGRESGPRGQMLKYYKLATDYDRMNAEGAQPVRGQMLTIKQLTGIKEFNQRAATFSLDAYVLPFGAGVDADMVDATKYTVYLQEAGTILPSKEYYGTETGDQLLEYFSAVMTELLVQAGESADDAAAIVKGAIAFDAILVEYAKTAEESSDYTSIYNPISSRTLKSYSQNIDLLGILTKLLHKEPSEIVVTNVEFFQNIDKIINEENFELMKNWMTAMAVYSAAPYLSDQMRETYYSYSMVLTGMEEIPDRKKDAYALTDSAFGPVLGEIYVEKHFSAEAKKDVENMIDNMIAVYKERLNANEWLGDQTKREAIRKLDNMTVMVGYPETLPEAYDTLRVNTDKSFYENARTITRLSSELNYAKYGKTVDRSEWITTAHTVNAFYNPTNNSITFPAGILQAPFYDVEQSDSANYGGIGMVIAHEISHAFDNSGSKYDEKGNLSDWWTKEDYAEFEKRTQAMVALFDGRKHAEGTVSGTITLGENIADAGGIRCALEVTKSLPDGNLEEFFTNYATIWAQVARPEYEQLLLSLDVHAPNKLRVNVQLSNVQEFYDTYDVTAEDGMYIAPENRVEIW